jgi:acyl carrier protein
MIDVGKVCAVVALQLGREKVEPDQRLVEDLGAESLDYVTIAAALERAFDVTIPDDDLYQVETVADFARVIDKSRAGGAS